MSFDPNNPTAIIKDGLIFAAVAKIFQYATNKVEDFVKDMPEDYYEEYLTAYSDAFVYLYIAC